MFALGGTRSAEDAVETTDPERYNVTKMTEGAVAGRMFNKVGQWVPNDHQNGWANDDLGHEEMVITAGDQGARWICLGRAYDVECEIYHQVVDGQVVLPLGWGMIGTRGALSCSGLLVEPLSYVSSRQEEVYVEGNGDTLFIRHWAP